MNDVDNQIISLPFGDVDGCGDFGDGLLPHYKDPLNYRGLYFAFRGSKKKNTKYQVSQSIVV